MGAVFSILAYREDCEENGNINESETTPCNKYCQTINSYAHDIRELESLHEDQERMKRELEVKQETIENLTHVIKTHVDWEAIRYGITNNTSTVLKDDGEDVENIGGQIKSEALTNDVFFDSLEHNRQIEN